MTQYIIINGEGTIQGINDNNSNLPKGYEAREINPVVATALESVLSDMAVMTNLLKIRGSL